MQNQVFFVSIFAIKLYAAYGLSKKNLFGVA